MTETTVAVETNGTVAVEPKGKATKFGKLFALASKAKDTTFTLSRETDGGKFALRLEGLPKNFTPKGVEELAGRVGGRVRVTVGVGAAKGQAAGTLGMTHAAETVRELTEA